MIKVLAINSLISIILVLAGVIILLGEEKGLVMA